MQSRGTTLVPRAAAPPGASLTLDVTETTRTPSASPIVRTCRPFENTISKDEFFAATLDVWEIRPEHARRVGHPAPFPVELPERLIQLYTYRGDVVLDPFLGSGSTAVAAVRTDRRYVGYDTDPAYADLAESRIADEHAA